MNEAAQQQEFSKGQTLYWVNRERRQGPPHDVTITKVGRKWLELSNSRRVDRETLQEDSNWPGRCYLSQADYEAQQSRNSAWESLKRKLSYEFQVPPHLSLTEIEQVSRLLFPNE